MVSAPSGTGAPVKMRTASPRPTLPLKPAPGGGLPDQLERGRQRREVFGADRIAVHGRGIERRLGERCGEVLRQHAAARAIERHTLRFERRQTLGHAGEGFGDGEEEPSAPQRRNVPERPPVFSTRRMPENDIARSTALHMS